MNPTIVTFCRLSPWLAAAWIAIGLAEFSTSGALKLSPPPDEGSPPRPVPAATPAGAGAGSLPRAAAETEVIEPLRLILELTDGSRVIGVPTVTNLQMRTSFGSISVDLSRLQSLEFTKDKETVAAVLQNGDRLTGSLNLPVVEIKTSFGPIKVPVAIIRKFGVNAGGKNRGGLVLHYTFDKNEGDVVRDQSGQGHDGRFSGARWTDQGKAGGGCMIRGGTEEVVVGNTEQMNYEDYSVAIWVKRANGEMISDGGWPCAIFGPSGGAPGMFALVGTEADGRLYTYGINGNRYTIQARLGDISWHHVTLVKQGKMKTLYLDGDSVGEVESDQTGDFRQGFSIGSAGNKIGYPFVGTLDEVMIFNRPLAAQEVRRLANATP